LPLLLFCLSPFLVVLFSHRPSFAYVKKHWKNCETEDRDSARRRDWSGRRMKRTASENREKRPMQKLEKHI